MSLEDTWKSILFPQELSSGFHIRVTTSHSQGLLYFTFSFCCCKIPFLYFYGFLNKVCFSRISFFSPPGYPQSIPKSLPLSYLMCPFVHSILIITRSYPLFVSFLFFFCFASIYTHFLYAHILQTRAHMWEKTWFLSFWSLVTSLDMLSKFIDFSANYVTCFSFQLNKIPHVFFIFHCKS